jgi:hypothetical protein
MRVYIFVQYFNIIAMDKKFMCSIRLQTLLMAYSKVMAVKHLLVSDRSE